jgi:dihydrofolate synthase/folylpolyglutamate synthase
MALHPRSIDLSLDRIERLMARLGAPQRRLAPVVHVAGTNGKGSVVAYLRAMLEANGRRVHVYTSPHLVRFNERIRLAGRIIDNDRLIDLLEHCERINAGEPITFFEVTTAAAFLAFAETPADAVLLETGLGGRLDATNLVARPALTAITPVAMDHMHYLGNSLAAIAGEKAGIMKPGVACVVGPQSPAAADVIGARARALAAPLHQFGRDWSVALAAGRMLWQGGGREIELPLPALPGRHQVENAGIAMACAKLLPGFALTDQDLARGLETVEWPARLQRLRRGPLVEAAPAGSEIWLDGGHNPAAAEALAATLGQWRLAEAPCARRHYAIIGMLNSKDARGFVAPLAPAMDMLVAIAIPGEANSLSAAEMAGFASVAGIKSVGADDVVQAMALIARMEDAAKAGVAPRILICGSLYLAGRILADNG